MKKKIAGFLILCVALPIFLSAQDIPTPKFGKVHPDEFKKTSYEVDPEAAAVILFDKGESALEGNSRGWFSVKSKHYKKVHILNKNGYDAGDISILLYNSGRSEESVRGLKAVSYNLENGKVVETKLEKSSIFTESINNKWSMVKFTLPNLKEGTIFEIEYTLTSEFIFNFHPWEFQGNYPRLWSEYKAAIPQFMVYLFLAQGYHPFHINTNRSYNTVFSVSSTGSSGRSQNVSLSSSVTEYRWVMKDVPALKDESYTTTVKNHISKIEFQLNEYRDPLEYKKIMHSWTALSKELMNDESFGLPLTQPNGFLNEIISSAIAGSETDLDKARSIYNHVITNYTSTTNTGLYFSKSLRNIIRDKNGTTPDINLFLTALLVKAGFEADPVILSTRSHGFTYELYPIIDKFNYTITRVRINDKYYFLDASSKLGFGRLPVELFNGHGRVINANATAIALNSNEIKENSITTFFIANTPEGLKGSYKKIPGYYESMRIRRNVYQNSEKEFFDNIKKSVSEGISITETSIDSLNKNDIPVAIKFDFDFETKGVGIIYFNPLMLEDFKDNPFKAANRKYPIEMPYGVNSNYILSFALPEGYEVDELPKSITVKLNEKNDVVYDYKISLSDNIISLQSRLLINRTYYTPDEYEGLRAFFNLVVNKQNENIVLKRTRP